MGMRLRVFLTSEEDRTLRELRRATTIPQRVKDRADVVRMSARGGLCRNHRRLLQLACRDGAQDVEALADRWFGRFMGSSWTRQTPLLARGRYGLPRGGLENG